MSGAKIIVGGAKLEKLAKALERMERGGKEFVAGARAVRKIVEEDGGGGDYAEEAVRWVAECSREAGFRAHVIREALTPDGDE